MESTVNAEASRAPLRRRQVARTEERIVTAATRLFLAEGYVVTTLAAVAEEAQVAARTVYVRFGTKAALFHRVLDVAVVGDGEPVTARERDWTQVTMTAPTRTDRITALAAIGRTMMERAGAVFVVAHEAATVEPAIAEHLQAGREQTREFCRTMWTQMRDDGLLDPAADLTHAVNTASVLVAGETYQLVTRMLRLGLDEYEDWLRHNLLQLCTGGPRGQNADQEHDPPGVGPSCGAAGSDRPPRGHRPPPGRSPR